MMVGRFIGRLFLINALMLLILGPEADGGRKRGHEEASTETSVHSTRTTRQTAQKKTTTDEAHKIASRAEDTLTQEDINRLTKRQHFAKPTLDVAFKHMLLDDDDRTPLISFLTAFTGINIRSVRHNATALPILKRAPDEKQTFLDLACQDNEGRHFIVEVQVKEQSFWNARALYYAAGTYSQQLAEGDRWANLQPVIALNILDHDRATLPDGDYKRDFQFLDREHLTNLKPGVDRSDPAQLTYLRIIQCELPRADLATMTPCSLRQWLQLLKDAATMKKIPDDVDEAIRKAYQRLELKKWGASLLTDYTKEALNLEDYKEALDKQHNKGKEEGIQEGIQKGKKEGEINAKKQMALNLLEQGVNMKVIAQTSNLSEKDIQKLAQRIKRRSH